MLRSFNDVGPTTASKILARKRPRLLPIYDLIIAAEFGLKGSLRHWAGMRPALQEDEGRLHLWAVESIQQTKIPIRLTPLCTQPMSVADAVAAVFSSWPHANRLAVLLVPKLPPRRRAVISPGPFARRPQNHLLPWWLPAQLRKAPRPAHE
jgi:Family of unknown function (DUF6308)